MITLDVYDQSGKQVNQINLEDRVFDGKVNPTLMHQAVVAFLTNQRRGLAIAKTKGEVSGGGRKPWRQKGTGRARVGSNRSPLWRGGGTVFGPRPHSFHKDVPHRMKINALKSVLNTRLKDKNILIVDNIKIGSHKTKELSKILNNLNLGAIKTTLVVKNINSNLKLASGNLENFHLEKAQELNAYSALNCKQLVFTQEALRIVEGRSEEHTSELQSH